MPLFGLLRTATEVHWTCRRFLSTVCRRFSESFRWSFYIQREGSSNSRAQTSGVHSFRCMFDVLLGSFPERLSCQRRDLCFFSLLLLSVFDSMIGIKSSEEGKVWKLLKAEPLPDGSGHFFNLSVQNKILNVDENIYIPITKAEFTVLVSAFNFILP
ncbi:hypothetical protein NE237_006855 [Protea cynaroides]|uniref:Uncharacterized protein n=1 Tax=Protea cynaroides TaxID=273540 RepID=A0A9Q0KNW0_9MAGN|nr:hypothetical protein NE237_006855 [Protea cynaroides]